MQGQLHVHQDISGVGACQSNITRPKKCPVLGAKDKQMKQKNEFSSVADKIKSRILQGKKYQNK